MSKKNCEEFGQLHETLKPKRLNRVGQAQTEKLFVGVCEANLKHAFSPNIHHIIALLVKCKCKLKVKVRKKVTLWSQIKVSWS